MYARWISNVCTIPDVIGMTESAASTAVNNAGFLYEFTDYLDTTNSGLVGKVAAIDPPVGSQPGCGTNITLTIYRAPVVIAPTAVSAAPPVISRTNNSYIYSTTNGSWNNSPTSFSYQWRASRYVPYPPYYVTNLVGTDSSSYTSSSTYNDYDIYCTVTASNSAGSATATSNFITNTPVGDGPSGISVTLTPTGTQMAGTQLTANVSVTSGTSPITYTVQIFKKTGANPTNADTGLESGTTSATHTITTSEASGTPDRFIAYGTATNAYGSTTGYSSVVISTPYVPPAVAPSGGGVTLTPSGTQQAGTTICANVTAMSGTSPITYTTDIRKATGSSPTGSATSVSSGTGTGDSVCCHTITASEASGTPDQFKAYTVGTNSVGSFTVGSNTVISTPAVTTTTTVNCNTCNSYTPNDGTYPYTGTDPYGTCTSGSRYYRICVTPSGCSNTNDWGSCVPAATTTTTAAPTTTTANCNTCNSYYPSDGSYSLTTSDPYGTCASGNRYYRICVTQGSCPNITQYGSCVPAATATTTAAPTTTTTAGRPTVYWKCNSTDVANASNPCSSVGQCRQAGNTYFPAGCTSCCD